MLLSLNELFALVGPILVLALGGGGTCPKLRQRSRSFGRRFADGTLENRRRMGELIEAHVDSVDHEGGGIV